MVYGKTGKETQWKRGKGSMVNLESTGKLDMVDLKYGK